jgi:hypothetical protein
MSREGLQEKTVPEYNTNTRISRGMDHLIAVRKFCIEKIEAEEKGRGC